MLSKKYQYNCQQLFELLTQNDIKFWLMAGTLLGAVRDGKFIDHDSDIDIAIWAEDAQKFKDVISNSDWYYFQMWRRELGIIRYGFERADSKIDVFIMDKDESYAYMYSYMKNPYSAVWDTEWRMKFPAHLFDTIVPSNISSIKCFIPKEAKQILAAHYTESWEVSDEKWSNSKIPIIDYDYKELAIIIPTFLRDKKLELLVDSIKKTIHSEKYRLYIADQGLFDLEKDEYYTRLKDEGHKVFYLPFNSGLSYARNYLVSKTKEPFILVIDDDFEFTDETNIQNFIYILNSRPALGVVGGKLKNRGDYHFRICRMNNKFYYLKLYPKEWYYTLNTYLIKPIRFWYSDIVLNFAMYKREVFNSHSWDNDLKLAEHTYFFWVLKQLKKWNVAFTDTAIALHQSDENNSKIYNDFRRQINTSVGLDLLHKKMNLTEKDYITIEDTQ
jgi:glycosyltransferase involved in cell wall biosynthesis